MKPTSPKHDIEYNPAMPEAHGSEEISDEQSGNIGMQEALERGSDDADRTRPVDIDVHEGRNNDMDERRDNKSKI